MDGDVFFSFADQGEKHTFTENCVFYTYFLYGQQRKFGWAVYAQALCLVNVSEMLGQQPKTVVLHAFANSV